MEGLKNADEIVKVPGVHAICAVSSDVGNFGGYKQGDPNYEREINIVHDAAIKAGGKLCGPWAWKDCPDFSCLQAGNEMAGIARAAKIKLGEFADTRVSRR
jgi:2-keto-3-deoxy-L-rhamnonate aldolase RhmA